MAAREPYVATQIYSEFYYSEKVENRKRFSANLIGKNGFICYIQKMDSNGNWNTVNNFYLNEHNMPFLSRVIDLVIDDINKDNFNKIRTMKGSKSNLKFLTKKSGEELYIGLRIVSKNDDGNETNESIDFIYPKEKIYDMHKGIERLKIFSESVMDTYMGRNQFKTLHYNRYSDAVNNNNSVKDTDNSEEEDNPFKSDDDKKEVDPDDDRFDIPDDENKEDDLDIDEEDVKEAGKILDDLDEKESGKDE